MIFCILQKPKSDFSAKFLNFKFFPFQPFLTDTRVLAKLLHLLLQARKSLQKIRIWKKEFKRWRKCWENFIPDQKVSRFLDIVGASDLRLRFCQSFALVSANYLRLRFSEFLFSCRKRFKNAFYARIFL